MVRLTIYLFLMGIVQVFALDAYAQSTRLTLKFENTALEKVLAQIEEKSEFYFLYNKDLVDVEQKVTVNLEGKVITEILDVLLQGKEMRYVILGRQIVLANQYGESGVTGTSFSVQQPAVSGRVTDRGGAPLPGVTVVVKGTTTGTITNADGAFSLANVPQNSTLVFSFVGMKTQEVAVAGKTTINVTLEEETIGIEEVVAVGYGSARKIDLSGSVGTVEVKSLVKAPVASFAEALAGRVAGMQVSSADGQPGRTPGIIIRGTNSLTQSTAPLYVIDGFPVESPNPSALNPEEIESITILKDASSAAIYGSRAANGVILIQTKRGQKGAPVFNFTASMGFQMNAKEIEVMSPYEFLRYYKELHPNYEYVQNYFKEGKTLESYRDVEGVNWYDMVFRKGKVQIYNMSLRGGSDQTRYALSGSIHNQGGVIINTGFNRYNGRVTLDHDFSSRVKIGITSNYSYTGSYGQTVASISSANNISSTALYRTWAYRPITPELSDDFAFEEADSGINSGNEIRINPYIDLSNQHNLGGTGLIEGNGYLDVEMLKGLNLKITGGIRRNTAQQEIFYNAKTVQGSPLNPHNTNGRWGSLSTSNSNSWINEYILTYTKTFAEKHFFKALALYSLGESDYFNNGYSVRNLPNPELGVSGFDQGAPFDQQSMITYSTISSWAGRIDYNYDSKYIISATFRADGSSKFAKANRWGYFPGGAVAWNMGREPFFQNALPLISTSKIRFSYGINGNNRVGDFARFGSLSQHLSGYSWSNQTPTEAVIIATVPNDDLKWEKTTKINLGYELGFQNDRFRVEVDLYRNTTTDLLLNAPLPPSSGFASAMKNIGSLKNEGLEIVINTVNIQSRAINWTSSFNISFNKNTVLSLTEGQVNIGTVAAFESQFAVPLYLSRVGYPTGMMFGYIWDGNYQYDDFDNPAPGVYILKPSVPSNGNARSTIQPGDIKYVDINGDGVVNVWDKAIIGRGQPIHIGGFNNTLSYKSFTLNAFLQWAYGNNVYNANRLSLEGNSNGRSAMNQYASYIDRWSPDNQTNRNYRAGGNGPVGYHSSRVVEDGSFLRLKTLSLDYSLPKKYISLVHINELILNVSAQNLVTLTNYSGLDPEVSVRHAVLAPGFDFSAYPQAQTIVFGIKATF